jgi:hypothetical protein
VTNIIVSIATMIITNWGRVEIDWPAYSYCSRNNDTADLSRTQTGEVHEITKGTIWFDGSWKDVIINDKLIGTVTRKGKLQIVWEN